MGVFPTLILKPTAGERAGLFDGTKHCESPWKSEYGVPWYEIEVEFIYTANGVNRILSLDDSALRGLLIQGVGSLLRVHHNTSFVSISDALFDGERYTINVRSNNFTYRVRVNDVLEIDLGTKGALITTGAAGFVVGGIFFSGSYFHEGGLSIINTSFHETNSAGDITNELFIPDWENGDINTIPNIGADAPASSDAIWSPAGSGTYVNI